MTRGIETVYGHVRFRSRLEATWAGVFDMVGWSWEYEPVDLNGYVPDFVLMFPAGPVLAEVKPDFTVPALEANAAPKIDAAGWTTTNPNKAVIFGATWKPAPPYADDGMSDWHPSAGVLLQDDRPESDYRCWDTARWFTCSACGAVSLYHDTGSWRCTVAGCYDGDGYLGRAPALQAVWAEVRNVMQWKPINDVRKTVRWTPL